MRKISVVIPTFNSWKTLRSCINSIQSQTLKPFEIIVVDNASSDNTTPKVKKVFPNVKLISLKKNLGVTGGRNRGFEKTSSKSEYVFFFDHDMVGDKKMLWELVSVMEEENVGITTPKIYYFEERKRIWSAGTGINLWTGQVNARSGIDRGQFDQIIEIEVAPAAIMVKREIIKKLRGFDERYFVTYDDTDFCYRAWVKGYKVLYAPLAVAFHRLSTDPKDEAKRLLSRAYWVGRNKVLFMKDFGKSFPVFIFFLPIFCIYYLVLAIAYGSISQWLEFIKGTWAGIRYSP